MPLWRAREGAAVDSYSDPFERGTVGISELQAMGDHGPVGGTAELAAGSACRVDDGETRPMAASAKVIERWP